MRNDARGRTRIATPCLFSLLILACGLGDGWAAGHSRARLWNEQNLAAIRVSFPNPPVHARNLFHSSVAMWDAWAAYDTNAVGYIHHEFATANDVPTARDEAVSYAAFRILVNRYAGSAGVEVITNALISQMSELGYDPNITNTVGSSPAALGNRVAATVLRHTLTDNSNEIIDYVDGTYQPVNEPMILAQSGTTLIDFNRWQPLAFEVRVTQNGLPVENIQTFVGSHWGNVLPFAISRPAGSDLYLDPGRPPQLGGADQAAFQSNNVEVIRLSSWLDPDAGHTLDISPGAMGNNTLGLNDGQGHALNPATGLPYVPNRVNRADLGRVMAEFWADGPHSETPPGHWNTLANAVVDHPAFQRRFGGTGPVVDPLEWDVKMYFTLNAAVHDAAIAAWGCKRAYDYIRPISSIRLMGSLGQSTDPNAPSYHPQGLPLIPNLIELITTASTAHGQRHAHLNTHVGKVAIYCWGGEPDDPETQYTGSKWILPGDWFPYQRDTFVTPAFAGYVSGHSAFSRAAAEVLTRLTGSPYFPGGIGSFTAAVNSLEFEQGPSTEVILQWATYYDAADQAGLSRLYGGIHVAADDGPGRIMGAACGIAAHELATRYFEGSIDTVLFSELPVIFCPSNQVVSITSGSEAAVATFTPTVIDHQDTQLVATCIPSSGSAFPPGITVVNCSVLDSDGNRAGCNFTVTAVKPFITDARLGSIRNDFTGWIGLELITHATRITVTHLGRILTPGDNRPHTLKLVNAETETDLPGSETTISLPGTAAPGDYVYGALPKPIELAPFSLYYLVSSEVQGGDRWYDVRTEVTTTPDAYAEVGVYFGSGFPWVAAGEPPNHTYGPVDFQYYVTQINPTPTVSIVSPPPASVFLLPATIPIVAEAALTITNVDFYAGSTLIGQAITPPFAFNWTNPPAGNHLLSVRTTDLSGTTRTSQVVSVSVTTTSTASGIPFVDTATPGALRRDFNGYVGMKITTGPEPMIVSALGRLFAAGNIQEHWIKLVRASDLAKVPGGSVRVSMKGGQPGEFKYQPLPSPVTLLPNTSYFLASEERHHGDWWHDLNSTAIPGGPGRVDGPVYLASGNAWTFLPSSSKGYGLVNFIYNADSSPPPLSISIVSPADGAVLAAPAEITIDVQTRSDVSQVTFHHGADQIGHADTPPFSFLWSNVPAGTYALEARTTAPGGIMATSTLVHITVSSTPPAVGSEFIQDQITGRPRNDFSGWIGGTITVGNKPITVTALGRLTLPGNNQSHRLKLVRAGNQLDVPGAAVSVSMTGATPGQFRYTPLTTPATLDRNVTYYLVSEEASGGDLWADLNTSVTPAPVASVDSAVFFGGSYSWTPAASANKMYGPVSFKFVEAGPAAPTLTLSEPSDGSIYFGLTNVTIKTQSGAGIAQVEFFRNGISLGSDNTPPFELVWTNPPPGIHVLAATGTTTNGVSIAGGQTVITVTTNTPGAGTPLVIDVLPGNLRNDFTGWVGYKLTVGEEPILVLSLGRLAAPGNNRSHRVKLVRAGDQTDVPQAIVTVPTVGTTAGEFRYIGLPAPVTLEARTSYYLATEEVAKGDAWYDSNTRVTPGSAGTIQSLVYSVGSGGSWIEPGQAGYAYGAPNLRYLPATGSALAKAPTTVSIAATSASATTANPEQWIRLEARRIHDGFALHLHGTPGQQFVLERSDNLVHWISLGLQTLTGNPMVVKDLEPGIKRQRFYRARLLTGNED